VDVGDKLRVIFYCRCNDQLGLNVRYFEVATKTGLGVSEEAIANSMFDAYDSLYAALLSNQASFAGVTVQKVAPLPKGTVFSSTDAAVTGIGGAELLPKQVSGLISLYTTIGGREYRGRMYVPFPEMEANTTGGLPDTGYLALLNDLAIFADNTITSTVGADANSMFPVVYSRKLDVYTRLDRGVRRTKWATQRRRGDFGPVNLTPF